ncbi:sigma-70 family RNA polymerase sigma factor [Paenibacillus sp. LS1]|uniref:sigma factor-like helix-turn-helix DNA-binding protein n=1 Tax=Paenibacillus sp. LS1 TaxID=2992120 RepID=UPI00222E93FB|nr:sigma factor-like helix-turn-helix DNA-binding protein [Paenibacillus sp. LS1]MCW3795404.1 sigma-70 family RNA polymerase sigma factor [Paenibacillus sp. LS1]
MEEKHEVYERYKREIYRIGWRVQYKAKKIRNKEDPINDTIPASNNFTKLSDDKIWINQLMESLPQKGKMIIDQIYIQGRTEEEVAHNLQISQQAVNKWKRKMITQLSQIANY